MAEFSGFTSLLIFTFPLFTVFLWGYWKLFEKSGRKGWEAIVPIYNLWVHLKIIGRPGYGDLRLIGGYDLYERDGHTLKLSAGLSFPTGSTDERDGTPAGPNQPLPYPMQIGSGTFDLLPGVNYTGLSEDWSWGAQINAVVRLGENDRDYTFGNIYQGSIWAARKWAPWVSSSLRLKGEIEENIDGVDPRLNPALVPTADPDRRGGNRAEIGLGLNFMIPSGPLQGVGLSVEGLVPVYQDLEGPQLERDYTLLIGLRKMF